METDQSKGDGATETIYPHATIARYAFTTNISIQSPEGSRKVEIPDDIAPIEAARFAAFMACACVSSRLYLEDFAHWNEAKRLGIDRLFRLENGN